ncbi:TPA: flagellar basal-body rod protein FlgF [Legionella pneumophila subsp. pneumophila]|uniref:Flagellar basal-body rod protein FlgF n=1 Tax=Legionella pneumophila (strain Lens) TaxID=297245 RepID=Q5WX70_LEGPL|nr:flagellar basal-body rod protein FlgF [Legionella pneumophila]AOW52175.1 flagellar basal-body rod protein FlgF [Legionella pneumophila subsp. pneumophila]AOW54236.1 flagellar basal-body rod protein FlgF [Legionella pneumophila subsp. pneumophila]AOW57473.1 flagellar basal-body rod protein FlgF [Legionella pneumophila subsp. pneumophila]AOW62349.1 flagellar basal-body rod protein FlgF [Legionella pneumophila subsp. pneumophila]AOW62970.1 flagellar basal-body rod protein FlgF [Legionella pneu
MEPILYNSISGGRSDFKRQEIIANNLANINTPGFKADLYQAQTMYMNNANGNNQFSAHSFITQNANGVDTSPGEIITTGRDLDVAIDGDGWIAVQDSQGREAYTRGGSLRLNPNGQLITASGKVVLGDGGPISIPPAQSIEIGSDGTISIVPLEGDVKSLAILDRIKLVTLDRNNIYKNDEGLIQLKSGAAIANSNIKLQSGALEGSNVNAIDQMVAMISAGREFDAQMKLLSTVDDNGQKLAQLLQE